MTSSKELRNPQIRKAYRAQVSFDMIDYTSRKCSSQEYSFETNLANQFIKTLLTKSFESHLEVIVLKDMSPLLKG